MIALVITIIVLLILAGVTIVTLTGDNGLLQKAQTAKEQNEEAIRLEKIQAEVVGSYELTGEIDIDALNTNLGQLKGLTYKGNALSSTNKISELPEIVELDGYEFEISEKGKVDKPFVFNPETLIIGDAINTDKYGYKVKNYAVKTNETGSWRLFYQDRNYTYIISDNCIGDYIPKDYYMKYTDGESINIVGKKLNKDIN